MYFWTISCKGSTETVKALTFKDACEKANFNIYQTKVIKVV